MCLGVPGKLVRIEGGTDDVPMGVVSFGGIEKRICLAYVPEAEEGTYVIVHVGFAISTIDEEEAQSVFAMLREMGELAELEPSDGETEGTS